jgi:membrane-associated phospholipid phosphatase
MVQRESGNKKLCTSWKKVYAIFMESSFFKRKFGGLYLYQAVLLILLPILLIVIGSFADLTISQTIAKPGNVFSLIISIIGEFPFYALVGSIGTLLFIYFKTQNNTRLFAGIFSSIVFVGAGGALYGYTTIHDYLSSLPLSIVIGILAVLAAQFGFYFLFRKADKEEIKRACRFFFWGSVFTFIFLFAIKYVGYRPRYILLVDSNYGARADFYRDWWSFDSSLRNALLSQYPTLTKDWFYSLGSGHAAFSSFMVVTIYFSHLNDKLKNKENWFFFGSLAFAFIVGLGRLIGGSHYLSDIGIGYLIANIFVVFLGRHYYREEPLENPVIKETTVPSK